MSIILKKLSILDFTFNVLLTKHLNTSAVVIEEPMALEKLFRERSVAIILDHFIAHKMHDYNTSEVARYTGLNRITVAKNMGVLIEAGILKPTRTIGRATQYALDRDNEVTKKLLEFDFIYNKFMLSKAAEGLTKKEKIVA
jgi:hypothetical protein